MCSGKKKRCVSVESSERVSEGDVTALAANTDLLFRSLSSLFDGKTSNLILILNKKFRFD